MNKSKKLIYATVLASFFGWGFWAYIVNSSGGDKSAAVRSALAQAIYSTVMTIYMSFSVLFIAKRTRHWRWVRIWPTIGTVGHTGLILILVHYFNHTPNILKTVSLPIVASLVYCFVLSGTATITGQK
jgi:hypothetical protein